MATLLAMIPRGEARYCRTTCAHLPMSGHAPDRLDHVPLLSRNEYLATMGRAQPMRLADAPPVDLGLYFRSIDEHDFQGFDFSAADIEGARSVDGGTWLHVSLRADVPNVFLVIVVEGRSNEVHGHYLLNLNEVYGLDE